MNNNYFIQILMMENKIENKYSKISNNFDDIKIKNINYFKPSQQNENDISESFQNQNVINFGNSPTKPIHSIKDRTNSLLNNKLGPNKQFEERKNIENDNFINLKEKSNYINNKNGNNGFIYNKFNFLNESNKNNNNSNNIKNILSQNKNIINEINTIINNENEPKTESNYLKNNYINDYYSPNLNNKDQEINDYKENKRKGKTYFNYNDELQNKIDRQDNYFNNIEKYNINGNNQINDNKNNNNSTNDSLNTNRTISNYNFGKSNLD